MNDNNHNDALSVAFLAVLIVTAVASVAGLAIDIILLIRDTEVVNPPGITIINEVKPEPVLYCPEDGNPNHDNDATNNPGGDAFPSYRECYGTEPVPIGGLILGQEYCAVDDIEGPLYNFTFSGEAPEEPGTFIIEGKCVDG